jgi:AcrR family transcriptional regulator
MGRKQTWDEEELLSRVMALFRRRGYGETSLQHIELATGLHPGSLYKAYGSKEGLFVRAMAAYNERVVEARVRMHLDGATAPLDGIRDYFRSTYDGVAPNDPGCLLTNTAIEAAHVGDDARALVTRGFNTIERGFARAIARAQDCGEVDRDVAPRRAPAALCALYQGLLVLVRFGAPRAKLAATTDAALAILASNDMQKKGRRR